MFIGRKEELQELENLYKSSTSKLTVIYGRRRIGKSTLIEHFSQKKHLLHFEGLENLDTSEQIASFTQELDKQISDPLLKSVKFKNWFEIFDYLTHYFKNQKNKTILFLDELQWLAVNKSPLISILKKYWDQEWKKLNILVILCGSVSSYMVKKVVKSKALYGRIDKEFILSPLSLNEVHLMLKQKRSKEEVLKYMMVLGGIPRYFESIDTNKSFEQNMEQLFFKKNSLFFNEFEKIFYSQFKEHRNYEKIVSFLCDQSKTLAEISKHLKLPSGGGVKFYLDNLEKAAFITPYIPYNKNKTTKLIKYKLTDEYLRFYFKYIKPNELIISHNIKNRNLFNTLTNESFDIWLGFAFENFCMKYAPQLAELMDFSEKVKMYGPAFDRASNGFQVDLLFTRSDKTITLCEIKYSHKPINTKIVKDVNHKIEQLKIPRGYTLEKALISLYGQDENLKNLDYFHHSLTLEDFFNY